MTLNDINIRDPFVLPFEGKYYMYGTRVTDNWSELGGFDVYVSEDLANWSEALEVFHKPVDFWADRDFWAPEVHYYNGAFYAFISLKSSDCRRGTQILKSSSPIGPFLLHSDGPVTPSGWDCLDGTLYLDDSGEPYMVFCHEWVQVGDGEMCIIKLSSDLKESISEPILLFKASEPAWSRGIQNGPNFVTDGPYLYRLNNHNCNKNLSSTKDDSSKEPLLMLWSSYGENGYVEAIARSVNGDINGPWSHDIELLYQKDGGHGMIFKAIDGQLYLTLHTPNERWKERPSFIKLEESENTIRVELQ